MPHASCPPPPALLPHPVNARLGKGLLELLVVADKLIVIPHVEIDLARSRNGGDHQGLLIRTPRQRTHVVVACAQPHALTHPNANARSDWTAHPRSKHHPLEYLFHVDSAWMQAVHELAGHGAVARLQGEEEPGEPYGELRPAGALSWGNVHRKTPPGVGDRPPRRRPQRTSSIRSSLRPRTEFSHPRMAALLENMFSAIMPRVVILGEN